MIKLKGETHYRFNCLCDNIFCISLRIVRAPEAQSISIWKREQAQHFLPPYGNVSFSFQVSHQQADIRARLGTHGLSVFHTKGPLKGELVLLGESGQNSEQAVFRKFCSLLVDQKRSGNASSTKVGMVLLIGMCDFELWLQLFWVFKLTAIISQLLHSRKSTNHDISFCESPIFCCSHILENNPSFPLLQRTAFVGVVYVCGTITAVSFLVLKSYSGLTTETVQCLFNAGVNY